MGLEDKHEKDTNLKHASQLNNSLDKDKGKKEIENLEMLGCGR